MSDELVLIPEPGTDLLPDGWADSTVVPWLAQQTEEQPLAEAQMRYAAIEAAIKTLDGDHFELTKARRYVEIRWGELRGKAELGGDRRSVQFASERIETVLSKDDDYKFRKLAEAAPRVMERIAQATDAEEISRAALLKVANGAHVGHSTGEHEWHTPPEYIEAARRIMGGIDCDPASSAAANEVVRATTFYDAQEDGRERVWGARVWMNPPYAQPLIMDFCSGLRQRFDRGDVEQACVLVNNATETAWFGELVAVAAVIYFPAERIRFIGPDGKRGAPLQGQAFFYAGPNASVLSDQMPGDGWFAWLR